MNTDKELLELAAKACGIDLEWDGDPSKWQSMYYKGKTYHSWNPLRDDGDCARMEAALMLDVMWDLSCVQAEQEELHITTLEMYLDHNDRQAARRRASVRCAAGIQRAKDQP